jgi:hypothetical protein
VLEKRQPCRKTTGHLGESRSSNYGREETGYGRAWVWVEVSKLLGCRQSRVSEKQTWQDEIPLEPRQRSERHWSGTLLCERQYFLVLMRGTRILKSMAGLLVGGTMVGGAAAHQKHLHTLHFSFDPARCAPIESVMALSNESKSCFVHFYHGLA